MSLGNLRVLKCPIRVSFMQTKQPSDWQCRSTKNNAAPPAQNSTENQGTEPCARPSTRAFNFRLNLATSTPTSHDAADLP